MDKKINLLILFLVMLIISSFSVIADRFAFYGRVSVDGNNTPTGAPVEVYVNYVRDDSAKMYVGGCTTCDSAQYSGKAFDASVGQIVYFQIWGINATQGEITLKESDSLGRELNLTANKSAAGVACSYSLGCADGYCCSGATEYTDGSGTGTCQASACSSGGGTPPSSGGGGGGGGGAATATNATSETIKTGYVPAGGTAKAAFTAEDLVVTNIDITIKTTVTASSITAINTGSNPGIATNAITAKEASGKIVVHSYLKITVSKISDTIIEKAIVKFKISKTEGYDPATVEFRKYDGVNKVWSSLPTKLASQDADYYYFEAETSGFSIFAIIGKKLPTQLTAFDIIDTIKGFYAGTSIYTAFEIIDLIKNFYGG